MSVRDPKVLSSTRVDRGWLMRHPGALADEALMLIASNPLRRRRIPRPRPLQLRRRTRLVRAPAI
jgi:hypothetical protein